MKIRTSFVPNSSSSSFIIEKTNLTDEQIRMIKEWRTEGLYLVTRCPWFKDRPFTEEECRKCYEADKESYEEHREKCKNADYRAEQLSNVSDPTTNPEKWPDFDTWSTFKFPYCWHTGGWNTSWHVREKDSPITVGAHVLKDDKGFLIVEGSYGGDFPMFEFLKAIGIAKVFEVTYVCWGDGPMFTEKNL